MYEERYKLHPISAFLNFIKGLKELIFPFIIIFGVNIFRDGGIRSMFNQGWQGFIPLMVGGGILIFLLVTGIIKWKRFVYWFEDGELRIEYGLFVKKKRYIPFERIQSLNYTEGIFHRPLGLVKVKVETAGSGKIGQAEAELTAISREDADRIENEMEKAKHQLPVKGALVMGPAEYVELTKKTTKSLYHMSIKELLILATTSGGIGVVISAVLIFLSQFSEFIPYDAVYEEVVSFLRFGLLIVVLTIFFVLLIAWIISVVMTVFANYQFTIQYDEDHIYISRGLLEKKKVSIPLKRVQGIKISQNPVRQLFGYATVVVESAGGTVGDKDEKIRLFPLVKNKRMLPMLTELFPEFVWSPKLVKAPKRSVHFFYRLSLVWWSPVFAAVGYFFYPYGLLVLLIIPLVIGIGVWQHRTVGYALDEKQLTMQFRGLGKHCYFMLKKRVQVVQITQSYFQRRKGIASTHATIKSGMMGATATTPHMEKEDATRILTWYEPSGTKRL
ncbi:PH domain-containing protein [Planococcus versutus]|uniref:YdbS-like PH domain-containing protein n=1 Tax=Planococcus versutus TaxID=1302659 RepID=A0A1B1RZT2_9BACL|nr:PH domain-containing protein [Planococcus versutus]ANU26424.1 hypothetical protein I858_005230 [Planococcus versutus]